MNKMKILKKITIAMEMTLCALSLLIILDGDFLMGGVIYLIFMILCAFEDFIFGE